MRQTCWTDDDTEFLLELLSLDTVSPMETGRVCDMERAQSLFSERARQIGFDVLMYEPASSSVLEDPAAPLSLIERAQAMGPLFFKTQPNLVLRLGRESIARTLMFNFHMDTVSSVLPVSCQSERITGRGVADAKGLGVAILAGVRQALAECAEIKDTISVLVQSVVGEEGGAMGFYGTRHLVQRGLSGRLNIVCEPTSFAYFDRTTASMTACIDVHGVGSTDDAPEVGQNATILLAAITSWFAQKLAPQVIAIGGKICIAGFETGPMHNRVYGSGRLLLNFSYPSLDIGVAIEQLAAEAFRTALTQFRDEYANCEVAHAAAVAASDISSFTWLKRRLPVLKNRNAEMEALLSRAGIERHDEASLSTPFTCDAMWLSSCSDCYSIVLGPGDLVGNNVHALGEFMNIADLDRFAKQVASIVLKFKDLPC